MKIHLFSKDDEVAYNPANQEASLEMNYDTQQLAIHCWMF